MASIVPNNPYDVTQQKASGVQPAASAETADLTTPASAMSSLPSDWSTYGPSQKIAYFNQQGYTEDRLRSAGVSQADIDWMRNNGYNGGTAMSGGTVSSNPQPTAGLVASYTPALSSVAKSNETAAGQVESLLAKDNPLLQRARTIALQNMNQRGLVNSSMAQGAGVAAMVDRITPIAQQDAQTYSQRALANMEATNEAGMFNVGESNRFSLQGAQQNFASAQAELDRAQQTNITNLQIQANKDLQIAQQNFQSAEAVLDRAFQNAQQDKSIRAQQDLQAAQQAFATAQAELDRAQQTNILNTQIAANKDLQRAQEQFQATQARLDKENQQAVIRLQDSINDANVSAGFAANVALNASNAINQILADPNIKPEDRPGAIANVVAASNSTLQWGSTFYNTTLPTVSAPTGTTSAVVTPGAGAGAGISSVGQTSSGPSISANVASYSPDQKAQVYNDLRSQGYTDGEIRAAAERELGVMRNEDWQYLTNLAATR